MPVLKPKARQVSFRISEDEYAVMMKLCAVYGARSVSDLARLAVFRLAEAPENGSAAPGASYIQGLEMRLAQLNRKVEVLSRLVRVSGNADAGKPASSMEP